MSLKRLTVISAVGSHNSFNNQTISYVSSYSGGSGTVSEQGLAGPAGTSNNLRTGGHHQGLHTMRPGANLHGNVNIMLGGAMLSVVVTVVCFVCYCCHRNIKKRSNSLYRQQWLEAEANMEIYSVEQCYDPPVASGGGFFLDSGSGGGGTGDYQALPVINTGAVNHSSGLPQFPYHPYHHLHQPHHYAPYPNGPPPSYDAVVAQDELLLAEAEAGAGPGTRRKRNDRPDGEELGPVDGASCPADGRREATPEGCKISCTEALLRKASARARFAGGGRPQTHHERRRLRYGDATEASGDDHDVTEPFWRSIELEEAERQEQQNSAPPLVERGARGTVSNCGCPATASGHPASGSQLAPIYCRNCGYHVQRVRLDRWEAASEQINPSPNAMAACSSASSSSCSARSFPSPDRPVGWLDAKNNDEELLVDYDGTATTGSTSGNLAVQNRPATSGINRIGDTEDVSNGAGSTFNNSAGNDMLTMPPTTTAMTSSVVRLDRANNNNASTDTSVRGQPVTPCSHPPPEAVGGAPTTANEAVRPAASRSIENNNVIVGSSLGETDGSPGQLGGVNLIEILIDQRPLSGEGTALEVSRVDSCNHPAGSASVTVDDRTNGNDTPGIRRPLDANGLVRLDMSRIIDHTGLPTYEAALKLESSGYV